MMFRPPNIAPGNNRNAGYRCGIGLLLLLQLTRVAHGKCPNWCSQHGICTGPGEDAFCICEMGYQGDDCGIRLCPKGDDPLTTDQADRALLLRTSAEDGPITGELTVTFNGETAVLDADARRTGDRECTSALQTLPNIDRVACTRSAVSEFGGGDYLISLLSFPTIPWENNHYGHFGNPSLEAFSCNISSADSGSSALCEFVDVVTENVKEYTECSQHGRCVRETGRCECSFGFRGEACDDITDSDDAQVVLAEGPFFTGSTLKLRANRGFSPDYSLIRAIAGPNDVMTLTGTGDLVLHEGALHIQPPPFIYPGSGTGEGSTRPPPDGHHWGTAHPPKALTVSGGSLDVRGAGAQVRSTRSNSPALLVSVGPIDEGLDGEGEGGIGGGKGPFSYSGVAMAVNVRESGNREAGLNRFHLLELSVGGTGAGSLEDERRSRDGDGDGDENDPRVLMSVRGDGRVSLAGGGGVIVKEGDLEVSRGGAKFEGSVTVGGSLDVGSGGVSVASGGTVRVADGGFEVSATAPTTAFAGGDGDDTGGLSTAAVGVVSADHRDFSGDVLRVEASGTGAAASGAVLVRAASAGQDVFEIKASGATSIKAGGLSVEAGGLQVGSGGATVGSGGLTVDGGFFLRSGALVIGDGESGDGFEVAHGGIRAASSDASTSALSASVANAGFGGAVLSASAPALSPSGSFRLLQATVGGGGRATPEKPGASDGEEVFFVDGTGRVAAAGGLETGPAGSLVAKGGLISQRSTVLERKRAVRDEAGDGTASVKSGRGGAGEVDGGGDKEEESGGVEVDASMGTFFEVPDDGREGSANVLRIKGEATAGQILVVRNGDADPTSGAVIIPPGYTVLFIHDGSSWRDVRVLEAAVTELRGVTSLSAAADLDIGDFSLKARHLVSTGNEAGGVAVFGGGGLLTSDKGLSWNAQTGTLTVPRLQASEVAEGMDFKGKPARNIALVNVTMDRIPFLKTARLMLETATSTAAQEQAGQRTSRALAAVAQPAGPGHGLAVFNKKGELSRAEGVTVFAGGVVDVSGIGPHLQHGDVDFQGYAARNLSLSGVSKIAGLDRLEVRELFVGTAASEGGAGGDGLKADRPKDPSPITVLTDKGELLSAGEAFSVDIGTGTFRAPRIGPHEVAGEVDFLGNGLRNAVLESPEIRGTVPSIHTNGLRVSTKSSITHGHLAVFSAEHPDGEGESGRGKSLGLALGGGGLAWQDGALQNVRLGGTTKLEGDLDLGGHRLLNFDFEAPDLEQIEELTIHQTLKLDKHKGARGSLLVLGGGGSIEPADPVDLDLQASSASVNNLVVSKGLSCGGDAKIDGKVSMTGTVDVEGEVRLLAGLDARGTRVANARLENARFEGVVRGGVDFDGSVSFGSLSKKGIEVGTLVMVGDEGELRAARGLELDEEKRVLVLEKVSGHEVTGTVNFGGEALESPAINFTAGGGIAGLTSLSVGDAGLDVTGTLSAASDVIVEGSVTVAGAVMGRGPYMDTSDARMKVEVEDMSANDALAVVKGLRAVTYALKPDALPSSRAGNFSEWSPGARRQHGFIAQEVERVAPEVVAEDSNGYKTVAYSRLVPALAAALSDMLDRVDKLEHFGAVTTPAIAVEAAAIPPPRKPATYPSVGPESSDGSTYGRRGSMGGRRMADVTVRGQQGTGESKDPVFDLMQLWVENTALRSRVGEMEKKMAELERKFKEV